MPHTNTTRRSFLASAAALPLALRALAEPTPEPAASWRTAPQWVLLGTDKGPGIFRATWDAATGRLGKPELVLRADRPDFFALHPKLPVLYSVNSVAGAGAAVSAFRLNPATATLELIGKQPSRGDGPCFVSVDATGRSAFVANYSAGSFAAYSLTTEGALFAPTGTLQCHQSPACGTQGPVKDRQEASHLHCATLAPTNDFVLACDLGNDAVEVLAIRPGEDNPLGAAQRFATRPGSGPRHVAFHPNGRWLYIIHELDSTLELFDWSIHNAQPRLQRREGSVIPTTAATLAPASTPPPTPTSNAACELIVSPNGKFLYACTRGEDSLTVFTIDDRTGLLREQQRLSCGGKVPRHMAFDPTNRWLLVANQAAPGTVTVFAHDPHTGHLTGPTQTLPADTPMFVEFV